MSTSANPCHLLRLPQELRDMIYNEVFSSSRLRHGLKYETVSWVDRNARRHQPPRPDGTPAAADWVLTEKTFRHVRPAANTLALLSTCKQIHAETSASWPRHVVFVFDTLETMLDRLSSLPIEQVQRIKHVMVQPSHTGVKRYPMASMLKVVPGLNLDTLTVVMSYASRSRQSCPENGSVIEDFVDYGVGWKKLYFVVPDTLMLTSLRHDLDGVETRPAQPSGWIDRMSMRDWNAEQSVEGRPALGARDKVRIYRATDAGAGAAFDPARREVFVQNPDEEPPKWLEIEDRIARKDARAEDAEERRAEQRGDKARELLVVVERRKGLDTVDRSEAPYSHSNDFRAWMGGKSWAEYWPSNRHITAAHEGEDLVDSYDGRFDFEWVASERKGVTWPVHPPPMPSAPVEENI